MAELSGPILTLLKELKEQSYIGDNPLKHWSKNKVICQLDIKNPDFIIEDRPLKNTPYGVRHLVASGRELLWVLMPLAPTWIGVVVPEAQ